MVTKGDYQKYEVEACLSVMVELMTLLGEYRESVILAGGWVPYFLFGKRKSGHSGSLDIDIALDFERISDASYRSILQLLKERGYVQGKQPFIFHREVESEKGGLVLVEVDLLAGEYGGTGKSHRTQKIQDIKARKTRGCDLLFQHNFQAKLKRKMPDGAVNEVRFKVADVVPFLVMKGMVIWERYKEKHAYDIYFTILNYPGGFKELIKVFEPFKANGLVREGLSKIKAKFQDLKGAGPVWAADFMALDDEEQLARVQRDAFEKVNAFLDALNIKPFDAPILL